MEKLRERTKNQKKGVSIFSLLLVFMMLFSTVVQAKPKSKKVTTGTVTGTITYNDPRNTSALPDHFASILLFSSKVKASDFSNVNIQNLATGTVDGNIVGKVFVGCGDTNGAYSIKKVPAGKYKVVLISNNLARTLDTTGLQDYTQTTEYNLLKSYMSTEQLSIFNNNVNMDRLASAYKEITIKKGKTLNLSYTFGSNNN